MATTITHDTTTITPELVLGYDSTRTSRNIVHQLLDGAIAVSHGATGLRTGTLEMLFLAEADAVAAEALHLNLGRFQLASTERTSIAMWYVVAPGGTVARQLDDETRERWLVRVDYQEVTA